MRLTLCFLCLLIANSAQAAYSPLGLSNGSTSISNARNILFNGAAMTGNGREAVVTYSGGGGSGTVTSVDISGDNGVTASGGPVTTSGTITVTLGAITPLSVVSAGKVNGTVLTASSGLVSDSVTPVSVSSGVGIKNHNGDTVLSVGLGSNTSLNASFAGSVSVAGNVDGRDVSADGGKLDTIETNADVTDAANVEAAGAVMDADIGVNVQAYDADLTNLAALDYTNNGSLITIVNDVVTMLNNGTDGQFLSVDGNGDLVWATGGGGATSLNDLSDAATTANSIALGSGAAGTAASNNTSLGINALTNSGASSDNMVAIGYRAGTTLVQAIKSALIGSGAGDAATSIINTVAIGYNTLGASTVGAATLESIVAIGDETASSASLAAGRFTCVGSGACRALTTGGNHVSLGYHALDANTTGTNNVAIGYDALGAVNTGSDNIAVGISAGDNITSGNNNIIIGKSIDAQSATGNGQLSIGNLIFGDGIDGTGTTVSSGNVGIGMVSPNERLTVEGNLSLDQQTSAPSATSGYGKIYDNGGSLYYKNGSGTETKLAPVVITKSVAIFGGATAVSTGEGTVYLLAGADLDGKDIISVGCGVEDKGVTGTTDVQLRRRRAGTNGDVLSVAVTIGDEWYAADGTINTANDDILEGDLFTFDVDAIHSGTAPNGLSCSFDAQ